MHVMLNEILTSPPLLSAFESYLDSVQAQENLLFIQALANLKCVNDVEEEVNRIFRTFIDDGAPMEVNITCRNDIKRDLATKRFATMTLTIANKIYEKAEAEIRLLLVSKVGDFARLSHLQTMTKVDPKPNQKRVVIVGGGFVGFTVASILDPMSHFHVTLIDTKESFEYTPGMIKMLVRPEDASSMRVRHDAYVKNGTVIVGYAMRLGPDAKAVEVNNKLIEFDYLVIATGSTYRSKLKSFDISALYRMSQLGTEYNELKMAKSILIIGGGLVGCELASEIATHEFPEGYVRRKKVTLIESHDSLVYRSPPMRRQKALDYLRDLGVTVILNERIVDFESLEHKTYLGVSGKRYTGYDKVYLATGTTPCSHLLSRSQENQGIDDCIDDWDRIKVKPTLQLDHWKLDHIFAGGDVTNIKEEKTGYSATLAGVCIARNICRMEKGKAPLRQGEKGTLPAPNLPLHGNKDNGGIGRQSLPNWKRTLAFLYPNWAKLKYFDEKEFLQVVAGEARHAREPAIGRVPRKMSDPSSSKKLVHLPPVLTGNYPSSSSSKPTSSIASSMVPPPSNLSGKDVISSSTNSDMSVDDMDSLEALNGSRSSMESNSLTHPPQNDDEAQICASLQSMYTSAIDKITEKRLRHQPLQVSPICDARSMNPHGTTARS
ncbi:hypothetical protein BC940DRAFT_63998 [Gongronella butleri]|nr:hypothetical protein BC940DRAFT_63998 [Gongronella butleri]